MKILITGGNGFIARSLKEAFEKQYDVSTFNRQDLDLLDENKVSECITNNNFDIVIHTATYDAAPKTSSKDPNKVLENNLKMFFNLARLNDHFGKMIYFGSGAEFSREHWMPRMKEEYFDQYVPTDQYGFSKYLMAKHAEASNNIYNLRLFGLFGKYDDWRYRFIPNACCSAVLDQPICINQNAIFDFMYIDDLTRIVQWFMTNNPQHHIYNVCSGQSYDLKTLAQKILKISSKQLDVTIKQDGCKKEYSGDNTLLLSELKDSRFLSIEESIKDLIDWYSNHQNLIKQEELHAYI